MAYYIIKTMGGDIIRITQEEYQSLLGKSGLVFIKSMGQAINTSIISRILPLEVYRDEERKKRLEGRVKSMTGVLHDGSKVIRHFGQWFLDDGFRDDNGRPEKLIDPKHYPEVARDCIPTPQEFMLEYEELPPQERLDKMLSFRGTDTRYLKEPTEVKNLLKDTWDRIDKLHETKEEDLKD